MTFRFVYPLFMQTSDSITVYTFAYIAGSTVFLCTDIQEHIHGRTIVHYYILLARAISIFIDFENQNRCMNNSSGKTMRLFRKK